MKKTITNAAAYIAANIDHDDVKYISGCIYKHHSCFSAEDNIGMAEKFNDLMEEFIDDNDLPSDWWDGDVDELFDEVLEVVYK